MIFLLLCVAITAVICAPSVAVDDSGDVIISSDGGIVKATTATGQQRNVLGPRMFGGRILLARNDATSTYPQLSDTFGHDNLALSSVASVDSLATAANLSGVGQFGFTCGLRLSFSGLSKPPVCTLQTTSNGARSTLPRRRIDTIVSQVTENVMELVLLHRQHQNNEWKIECEHGDSVVVMCVEAP
eukprot:TRINITY_DN1392_c0_g1_i1.p1 TRINITY_DN1392_c0_g1~~TRINITY_DN1392_c0_g1_i1.p1  ORF type:complete len:186 (+),score=24.31 TRINITY_DN1392_c0_g1_i1:93-650(+)